MRNPANKRRTIATMSAVAVAIAAIIAPTAAASAEAVACAPVNVSPAPSPRFYPPLVSGDREFEGHGPAITVSAKRVKLTTTTRDYLIVIVKMRAEETESDWSKAEGTQQTHTLYTAPTGCHINARLLPGAFDSNGYLARSSYANPFSLPAGDTDTLNPSFVAGYTVWDDRVGQDVNDYTSVQVRFKPFTVQFTN
jgi:hypothetical protein